MHGKILEERICSFEEGCWSVVNTLRPRKKIVQIAYHLNYFRCHGIELQSFVYALFTRGSIC